LKNDIHLSNITFNNSVNIWCNLIMIMKWLSHKYTYIHFHFTICFYHLLYHTIWHHWYEIIQLFLPLFNLQFVYKDVRLNYKYTLWCKCIILHILITINLYQPNWHYIHDTEQFEESCCELSIYVHCEVKCLFNEAVT
jgi:hypothetical protein